MKIEIKHRFTLAVLFTFESDTNTLRITVEAAIKSRANLYGADLSGADLSGEFLTKAPITILNLAWPVLITDHKMIIGCQRHTHDEWREFDVDTISKMHPDALPFWDKWAKPLLALCDTHRVDKL